ncbi:MAG: hypothetical protein WCF04_09215, partial [Candidatus Nanopelagicales bacterium]
MAPAPRIPEHRRLAEWRWGHPVAGTAVGLLSAAPSLPTRRRGGTVGLAHWARRALAAGSHRALRHLSSGLHRRMLDTWVSVLAAGQEPQRLS